MVKKTAKGGRKREKRAKRCPTGPGCRAMTPILAADLPRDPEFCKRRAQGRATLRQRRRDYCGAPRDPRAKESAMAKKTPGRVKKGGRS